MQNPHSTQTHFGFNFKTPNLTLLFRESGQVSAGRVNIVIPSLYRLKLGYCIVFEIGF